MKPISSAERVSSIQAAAAVLAGSAQGAVGRLLKKQTFGGQKPTSKQIGEIVEGIPKAAATYGLATPVPSPVDGEGWRLIGAAIVFQRGKAVGRPGRDNQFFRSLYEQIAGLLASGGDVLFGLEGREHTTQVEALLREYRECRFRYGRTWHTDAVDSRGVGMDDQLSFASLDFAAKKKRTKRDLFLAEMAAVAWSKLQAMMEPHYPKTGPQSGRRPFPLGTMLRIYYLQQWYNLSDPGAEEALYDIQMRAFAGLELGRNAIPDETTILNFRHLLERHDLTKTIFTTVAEHLAAKGELLRGGAIVDATLIAASPSTKTLGADKGYDTSDFVADLRQKRVTPHVAAKVKGSAIDGRTTRHESYRVSQRKRKLVEEAFGWAKTIAGMAKVKVRGLTRVRFKFTFAMAAYNLIRMPRLLAGV